MTMKKHIAKGLIASFLVMAPGQMAFADEITTAPKTVTAPNSIVYFLDNLISKIEITFTFNPVSKAELLNKIASERLAQAAALVNAGNIDLAKQAVSDGQDNQTAAQNIVNDTVAAPTEGTTEGTAETTESNTADSTAVDTLTQQIAKTADDAVTLLNDIVKAVPDEEQEYFQQAQQQEELHKASVQAFVTAIHNVNSARKALHFAQKALDQAGKNNDTANLAELQQAVSTAQAQYNASLTQLQQARAAKQGLEATKGDDKEDSNDSTAVSSQPAQTTQDTQAAQPDQSTATSTDGVTVTGDNTTTATVDNTNTTSTTDNTKTTTNTQNPSFKNYGQYRSNLAHQINAARKAAQQSMKGAKGHNRK